MPERSISENGADPPTPRRRGDATRRITASILLIIAHPALAAVIAVLASSRSSDPVILGRYSLPLGMVVLTSVSVLLLSTFRLLTRPSRYRRSVSSLMRRSRVLPELLLTVTVALVAFLLFMGGTLTPLMERPLFAWGLCTTLLSLGLGLPMLVSGDRWLLFRGRMLSLALGVTVSLLLAEAALHLLVKSSVYHPSLDLRPNMTMEIRNTAPGVRPVCMHTTNSLGLRGEEPPEDWDGAFTILTVGGSTTHCFYMDDSSTWPQLLQENLRLQNDRVWVGNGGLDGHTTRGHILFMREVTPRLLPDMVVVMCGVNDLSLSLKSNLQRTNSPWEEAGLGQRIIGSSILLQVLTRWKRVLFDDEIIVTEDLPYRFDAFPLDTEESPLPPDLRTLLPTLPEYGSNLRTMIRIGRELDVDMVFLTQPLMLQDNDYWRGRSDPTLSIEATGTVFSCATIWRLLNEFNMEMINICMEEDVPCFDLATTLGHDSTYFCDYMHFSESGTAEIARLVSNYLLQEGLVPAVTLEIGSY